MVLGHIVVRKLGGFAPYVAGDRSVVRNRNPFLGVCIPSQGENGGGVIGVGVRNSNILVVGGQNRSVIWRDDAGVNTLSAGIHVSYGAVGRLQGKHAIFVFHTGGDAIERYRKLFEISLAGLLGVGRLSGVSGVASDVDGYGRGIIVHLPAVSAVDEGDGLACCLAGNYTVRFIAVSIGVILADISRIIRRVDCDVVIVRAIGGAAAPLDAAGGVSAADQTVGLVVVLAVIAVHSNSARTKDGVRVSVLELFSRGCGGFVVDMNLNYIVLHQRYGYVTGISSYWNINLYALPACGLRINGNALYFIMRYMGVRNSFMIAHYS